MASASSRNALAWALCLAAAGCYDPTFRAGIHCAEDDACPSGLVCAPDRVCRTQDELPLPSEFPDAMPVACSDDEPCQSPPGLCLLPGRCNLETNLCQFPSRDCTALDRECAAGACDPVSGECVAVAADEAGTCGAGSTCGSFDTCAYPAECAQAGTQTRTCMEQVCRSGFCMPEVREDMQPCNRNTDGENCGGASVISDCPATCAGFNDLCDETGFHTCTCTSSFCLGGTCSDMRSGGCSQPCSRDTDGTECGVPTGGVCSSCVPDCERLCTDCNIPSCSAGTCSGVTVGDCIKSCPPTCIPL